MCDCGECEECFRGICHGLSVQVAALTARAEKAERERDEWKAQVDMLNAGCVACETEGKELAEANELLRGEKRQAEMERDEARLDLAAEAKAHDASSAGWKAVEIRYAQAVNRLATIVDEQVEPHPILGAEQLLTIVERALATSRRELAALQSSLAAHRERLQAELAREAATVARLEGERAEVQRMADEWGNDVIALRATSARMREALEDIVALATIESTEQTRIAAAALSPEPAPAQATAGERCETCGDSGRMWIVDGKHKCAGCVEGGTGQRPKAEPAGPAKEGT